MAKNKAQKAADRKKRNARLAHEGKIAKRARIIELAAKKRRMQDERVLHQVAAHTEALKIKHPELFESLQLAAQNVVNFSEAAVHFGTSADEVLAAMAAIEAAGGEAIIIDDGMRSSNAGSMLVDPNVFAAKSDAQIMSDMETFVREACINTQEKGESIDRVLAARMAASDTDAGLVD